jgi:hypothetical protein
VGEVDPTALLAGPEIAELWRRSPMRVDFALGSLQVSVDYSDTPACVPGTTKRIVTELRNPHPDAVGASCVLRLPANWPAAPQVREVTVPAGSSTTIAWAVAIPGATQLENTNQLALQVAPYARPAQPGAPIVLVGAHKYRVAGPYPLDGQTDRAVFDTPFEPEQAGGAGQSAAGRPGAWQERYALDNAVPIDGALDAPGVLYLQTYLWAPTERDVLIAAMATCPAKLWVNGAERVASFRYRPLRPNYGADNESSASVHLVAGWNEVLLKLVRGAGAAPAACHLLISSDDRLHHGQPDIGRTRLPWDT